MSHVLCGYSVAVIQSVAAKMARDMRRRAEARVAALRLDYPIFTEDVGMVARKLVRELAGNGATDATGGAIESLYAE